MTSDGAVCIQPSSHRESQWEPQPSHAGSEVLNLCIHRFFPIHTGTSTAVVTVQVLIRQPCCRHFMGTAFLSYIGDISRQMSDDSYNLFVPLSKTVP